MRLIVLAFFVFIGSGVLLSPHFIEGFQLPSDYLLYIPVSLALFAMLIQLEAFAYLKASVNNITKDKKIKRY